MGDGVGVRLEKRVVSREAELVETWEEGLQGGNSLEGGAHMQGAGAFRVGGLYGVSCPWEVGLHGGWGVPWPSW